MKTLYVILAVALLIGMCQESAIVSLTAGGTALGMYWALSRKTTQKSR